MTAVTEAFIRRMWAEGVPVPKIAQYLNASPLAIARCAKRLGLLSRPRGRPPADRQLTEPNQTQSVQTNTDSCGEIQTQPET